jgi:hypothetical protein
MAIKYLAGSSTGVAFSVLETRTVQVSNEALNPTSGYVGDTVYYTAIVQDNTGAALPSTFVVDLLFNNTKVVEGQQLNSSVYNPTTKTLQLSFQVPNVPAGNYTVKLSWAEQII